MSERLSTFDWFDFPEGRARFAGSTRGWDESGHHLFAIELGGTEYFGEIDQVFLANRNDFNLEIRSFGYRDEIFAGSPPPWDPLSSEEVAQVISLVQRLVERGLSFEEDRRPSVLAEFSNSRFMGVVAFKDGWATERIDASRSVPTSRMVAEVRR